MPELTQAIPVIAADAPVARHRRPCIPPSPLHVAGDEAIAHLVLWAIEDAIEVWLRATEPVVSRRERTWARRVA